MYGVVDNGQLYRLGGLPGREGQRSGSQLIVRPAARGRSARRGVVDRDRLGGGFRG